MDLEMKSRCEKCDSTLSHDAEAFICSYECTFCAVCTASFQERCPNCGGELVRRPRRPLVERVGVSEPAETSTRTWALSFAVSFAAWGLVTLTGTGSIYQLYRTMGKPMSFMSTLALESCQLMAFAPLSPLVFFFAMRYPLQRWNWGRRSLVYLAGGMFFCAAHMLMRGLTPYGVWNPQSNRWISVFWNSYGFHTKLVFLEQMFLRNVIDDITGVYIPIVFIGHAVGYYRKFRDRELHTAKLEGQLARARLQALKSQLQPHFLFNAMHSISALMLTDVRAADKAMSRLSELLRMSLEVDESQVTTLSRELEFVNSYLEIEKVRFADRLTVHLDIAPDTLDAEVPHLLLQPIAENAVRHGISRRTEQGEIHIIAIHLDNQLLLTVRDNGPGMSVPNGNPFREGVGLRTTRERLKSFYGQNQSVCIRTLSADGLEVNIRIPFRIHARPLLYDIDIFESRSRV